MLKRSSVIRVGSIVVLAFAVAQLACQSAPRRAQICEICQRPIHSNSLTVAEIGDRRQTFCCPACALASHAQGSQPQKVVELADYETGGRLAPREAYLVRGSDINPCARVRPLIDQDKEPHQVHYDRCSPSILAFAGKDTAAAFARAHGGTVMRFEELASTQVQ